MRVLCCLDGMNIDQVSKAVAMVANANDGTIGLLYVTDSGPHGEIERKREGLLRPRQPSGPLYERMRQAETVAAQEILQEGQRYLPGAETLHLEGRPEREIVNCPRTPGYGGSPLGPKSIGHVARFVLDHAPCPVLLVRPLSRNTFPTPP